MFQGAERARARTERACALCTSARSVHMLSSLPQCSWARMPWRPAGCPHVAVNHPAASGEARLLVTHPHLARQPKKEQCSGSLMRASSCGFVARRACWLGRLGGPYKQKLTLQSLCPCATRQSGRLRRQAQQNLSHAFQSFSAVARRHVQWRAAAAHTLRHTCTGTQACLAIPPPWSLGAPGAA
eukprot:359137-Chlamydomonas_euryale.AAC.7